MDVMSHDLEQVAGGFGPYDAGVAVGQFGRAAFNVFVEMGKLYTPIL
jgi:hypothetical protein